MGRRDVAAHDAPSRRLEKEFGLVYESRSGLITLSHRLRLEYHKPNVILRKLVEGKQNAFIASYEKTAEFLGRRRGWPPRTRRWPLILSLPKDGRMTHCCFRCGLRMFF